MLVSQPCRSPTLAEGRTCKRDTAKALRSHWETARWGDNGPRSRGKRAWRIPKGLRSRREHDWGIPKGTRERHQGDWRRDLRPTALNPQPSVGAAPASPSELGTSASV